MSRFFMSYATANETDFFDDFLNFHRLSRRDPGVERVDLSITISEVLPVTVQDQKIAEGLKDLANKNPRLRCYDVTFKSNVGRDFSSASIALNRMLETGEDGDLALFVNRSGHGPLSRNWYAKYATLLEKSKASLVGTSINGSGHPDGRLTGPLPHVQTYCFMARLGTLRPFSENFPAKNITDRVELIETGEIGLSRRILHNGGKIACLQWPNRVFDISSGSEKELLLGDVKEKTRGAPFLYKKNKNINRWNSSLLQKHKFRCWLRGIL